MKGTDCEYFITVKILSSHHEKIITEKEMDTKSQASSFKCEQCGYEMCNEKNLRQLKFCGVILPNNVCKLCNEAFHSPDKLSTHVLQCGPFICHQCNIPFIHTK